MQSTWDGVTPHAAFPLTYVTNAMQLFQKRGIDAFMHLGDAAHRGKNVEVQYHRGIFEKCFPHGKTKDGQNTLDANENVLKKRETTDKRNYHDNKEKSRQATGVNVYDVVIVGDDPKARLFKSVYFEGCNVAPGHEPNNGITEVEIPVAELPARKNLTIAVRPVSSLGTKGTTIGTTMRV